LKILVIGHNSFIGKKFLSRIKKNKYFFINTKFDEHDIYYFSNKQFYQKYFSRLQSKIDVSINFLYIFNTLDEKKINILLLQKIIFSLKKLKIKKNIYISSVNSYKNSIYDYGKTKYLCEQYYKTLKNFIIIRPSTVIDFNKKNKKILGGQGGKSLNFLNDLIDKLFILPIFGKGNFLHTFCFLDDLINFIFLISFKNYFKNKIINFFSGEYLSYLDFINFVLKIKKTNKIKIYLPLFIFKLFGYLLKLFIYDKSIFLKRLNNLLSQKIEYNFTSQINKKIKIQTASEY